MIERWETRFLITSSTGATRASRKSPVINGVDEI